MPQLDGKEIDLNDESIDPLVRAALMPDPTDEEEKSDPKVETPKKDPEDAEVIEDKEPKDPDPESAEALAKAAEVKEDPDPKDDPAQTRKEKREERKQRFIDSIRRDQEQDPARERLFEREPYDPLDYNKASEFDVKELAEDRTQYGDYKFSEGAKVERFYAQQEKFWNDVEHESKLLSMNPKYAFLDDSNAETFDEDRAATVNELYLEMVGFKSEPQFDKKTGRPIIDQNTGKQAVRNSVGRTDLSWGKFVERYVADMEDWAAEANENSAKNIAAQKSQSAIRPGGTSHTSGIGTIKPGDITRMSQAEFEKHEAEIDRQILSALK